jgi:hypothetical protein
MKRITIAAVAMLALLVAAVPAAAKPAKALYYEGETAGGSSIQFTLTGKRLSAVSGYLTTTCVPTHGAPITFSTEFNPPGSFVLGKSRKAVATEYMSYKGDVTKNYEIAITQDRKRHWVADIHVDYSYEEVVPLGPGELDQRFYICQGDDSFTFNA